MQITPPVRYGWGIAVLMLTALAFPGCPAPTVIEDVYGYNTVILRNEGDRPLLALFVVDPDIPGRGRNCIDDPGGLLPGRAIVVDGLNNGAYVLETEYMLTADETGDIDRRVVERLTGLNLFWGAEYIWYWYAPDPSVYPVPPTDEETTTVTR